MRNSMIAGCAAALLVAASFTAPAGAQSFPSKQVRFVVPYPPGGSGDFLGRLYSEYLGRTLGSTVIVENKPGAATNLALEQFARADADGHTLMLGTGQTMMNIAVGPVPGVDAFAVLAPVALIAEMPFVIAAHPDAGIASVKDLVAKARTQRLTISHAQFEPQLKLLQMATGAAIDSIPFKGGAPSVMAALGGQVNLVGSYLPVVMGQIRGGKLRAVGIASAARVSTLPDVATFAEQGFPKFTTTIWYTVVAPRGTPEPVLQRLTTVTLDVARDPQFVKSLQGGGAEPLPGTPQQALATMRKELDVWAEVAKAK